MVRHRDVAANVARHDDAEAEEHVPRAMLQKELELEHTAKEADNAPKGMEQRVGVKAALPQQEEATLRLVCVWRFQNHWTLRDSLALLVEACT